jgi:hypothetical protein
MTTLSPPYATDAAPTGFALNPDGAALWRAVWWEHRWLLAVWLVHRSLAFALDRAGVLPIHWLPWNGEYFQRLLLYAACWLAGMLLFDAIRRRELVTAQRRYLTARSLIGLALGALFIARESLLHEAFKRNIGRAVNPFRWDAALSRFDTWLHFGVPPWRWLDPLFHTGLMTRVLDLMYVGWFFLIVAGCCWINASADRPLRARAFLAYGLLWIFLGTGVAQVFTSAGPVYFHQVVSGANPYAPLMAHLDSVHTSMGLLAVDLQHDLWANFTAIPERPWFHVSAMPSMHVAIPVLFALVLHKRHWRLGAAAWVYTAFIVCGSIYLGWHYAVDGYVAILGALGCWWLAGRLLARRPVAVHR